MSRRSLFSVLAPFVVLLAGAAPAKSHAASPDVESLLAKMRAAYASVKSATFVTESQYGVCHFTCHNSFLAPSVLRYEALKVRPGEKDVAFTCIVNGARLYWRALPKGWAVYPVGPDNIFHVTQGISNLESLCFIEYDLQLSTARDHNMFGSDLKIGKNRSWKGRTFTVLEERTQSPKGVNFYYIDPKTHLIWRTISDYPGHPDMTTDIQVDRMQINVPIKGSLLPVLPKRSKY
jgi:hypothetical protein